MLSTFSKFLDAEEICMVYGLPLTSDVDAVIEQIKQTIAPFVKKVVSVTATKHFSKNEKDFFHGCLNGNYKVKVVPLVNHQIPNYVPIGKDEQVQAKVHYVRHLSEKKVMCNNCYSTEHLANSDSCEGISDWTKYVARFEKMRDDVLAINEDKQEISLGMKQTQQNPWEKVAADYPPGAIVKGVVRNLTNYGAFIEIDEGIDGLLHVTDMSWTRKVTHPSEMVDKGQEIECKVLSVDQQRRRIALGLKQMQDDPWTADIPDRYKVDDVVHGTITKITNFGVFVGLEDGLEGLLHISELSDDKVENAEELVQVGDPIDVKILRVDINSTITSTATLSITDLFYSLFVKSTKLVFTNEIHRSTCISNPSKNQRDSIDNGRRVRDCRLLESSGFSVDVMINLICDSYRSRAVIV